MVNGNNNYLESVPVVRTLDFSQKNLIYNGGNWHNHYCLGNGNLVKIPKSFDPISDIEVLVNFPYHYDLLKDEFLIAKDLYENEINVPFPNGVFNMRDMSTGEIYPGFSMQNLSWTIPLENLKIENYDQIKSLRDVQIKKSRELGYIPIDSSRPLNSLWDPINNKVYLIDFEFWKRTSVAEKRLNIA